ncbi:hypothetical protein [Paraburkholderia sp. BCC1886]|uniref:hypothetical protein n=1 Tax=Paraburkholderia sp. BCC1886 TaxID=2562670 RepID=UPI0011831E5B|nr:hypothetical protein [Paraburkholderia sp. BCC1886]
MALTYYFLGTGGVGASPDGTIPPNAVVCTEAQYQDPSQYIINYTTTPYSIEAISSATALQIAQANQVAAVSNACATSILQGFTSSALGAAYTYPAKSTDQINMLSSIESSHLIWDIFASDWVAGMTVTIGQYVVANSQLYQATVGGEASSAGEPAWPIVVDTPVLDGTAQWELWSTPFWCADVATGTWAWRDHSAKQMFQVGLDGKASILSSMKQNAVLAAMIAVATTIQAVEEITWP